jgi:DnaJ-class molecular chaperone
MFSRELKMVRKYVPIHFNVWLEENREDLKNVFEALNFVEDTKDCPMCDGDGVEECEMGYDHDCPECEGSGKVDQTPDEALYDYSINQYHQQVEKDKERVKAYYAQ